ncbi:TPA: type II toxin-antitoxin system mRNA interferase toxin, RelE/StbE family [Patescibacteria group bacterium]|nr:MAG: Plasmid stabilization system [Parcubacteria group bacterium GW2011_GWF2_40_10]KKR47475.1 MAG: Plasmid stabilization system [Parcubacteria group bacterium GW2011_GWA2_40_143]KKR58964.1 MAG: Plasmid stabilization system [Parcubacteria group bacterium GW2011_GWC2_40_31]KKR82193.1 MAG: Plasmid stabilization system [Parcubacteria group bacterium GW2011_GWD2_40_9]HBB56576.1 type II toxin-antitoxin system mRNA interferase toxin, RelE/StbE family [Patescibacteria group bacterium]
MKISFLPSFTKKFKKLEKSLQEEALEKIEFFKDPKNHKQLKVHKLHGELAGRYSFSVNYKFRIVFVYLSKSEAVLLAIGDHEIYDK